jgi:hypothetical protein
LSSKRRRKAVLGPAVLVSPARVFQCTACRAARGLRAIVRIRTGSVASGFFMMNLLE